jgi:hypothetical protein
LFERFEFKGRKRDLLLQFVNRNALEDGREILLDKLELLAVAGNRSVVNFFLVQGFRSGDGDGEEQEGAVLDDRQEFLDWKVLKKKLEGRFAGRDCEDLANGGGGCGAANVPVAANFA